MSTPLEHEGRSSDTLRDDQPLLSPSVRPTGTPEPSGQSRPGINWQRIRQVMRKSAFSPNWLPVPWRFPVVGYVAAVCLIGMALLLTMLLKGVFPTFALQGLLALLVILLVALLWGTGPGLVATLVGAVLFNFFILPPPFTWSFFLLQSILETIMFLVIGIAISLIVSRIEYARAQVAREKAHAAVQARQLSILFEAVPDAITVVDREGRIVRTNESARKLWLSFITDLEATFEQRHKETRLRN